jgi:hypothetical protein
MSLHHKLSKDELIVLVETIEESCNRKYERLKYKYDCLEKLTARAGHVFIDECNTCERWEMGCGKDIGFECYSSDSNGMFRIDNIADECARFMIYSCELCYKDTCYVCSCLNGSNIENSYGIKHVCCKTCKEKHNCQINKVTSV